MYDTSDAQRFERLLLPHLDAAYNLARWLTKSDSAAQDVVQESCLRAFRAMRRFNEVNPRMWLLTIVRRQSYDWLSKSAVDRQTLTIDDESEYEAAADDALTHLDTPEALMVRAQNRESLHRALETLPAPVREIVVLKELEDLSYKQIASLLDVPIGTVMSRLSRGRDMLKRALLAANE